MKTVTVKMLISLAGLALAAPFFAIALIVCAHAVALAHSTQDDLLLLALACGGAALSIINGFGRHADKTESETRGCVKARSDADSPGASTINLGY
ncbi:MAG TPA: hypothetical protein VD966_02755 [Pyrinomonadaceae bacterium]|jgi:hypothetical protein|nr:hypothetical protein [Pyrinomonadaceae bacterium]